MALSINTNAMALNARYKLASTNMDMSKTLEKLSSGLRINRAADDAAGLAVSEKLRSQIKGTGQAMRNAQDGISMIQTAEGALEEVHSMLQRMRELAVQSANDTYSTDDREAINNELQALKNEINAISARTKFNGKALLSGALSTQLNTSTSEVKNGTAFQAGTSGAGNTGGLVSYSNIDVSGALGGTTYTLSVSGGNLQLAGGSGAAQTIALNAAMTATGGAVGSVVSQTFDFNQKGIRLTLSITQNGNNGLPTSTQLGTAITASADALITATGSSSANFAIGAGSGGAASGDAISVSFSRVDISASGMSSLNTELTDFNTAVTADTFVTTDAEALISALDTAITTVNDRRGILGASQNRLEHSIKSLAVAMETLSSSESRIRDADVAEETSNMVRNQILSQAGTAILAQANQAPQGALQLLKG